MMEKIYLVVDLTTMAKKKKIIYIFRKEKYMLSQFKVFVTVPFLTHMLNARVWKLELLKISFP